MSTTFDAVGPSSSGTDTIVAAGTPTATLSWPHTTGSGADRWMRVDVVVGEQPDDASVTVDSVTYNDVAATFVARRHAGDQAHGFIETWELVAPASGTHDVMISVTLPTSPPPTKDVTLIAGSRSYTGVDQTTPYRNVTTAAGGGTLASVTVASAVGNIASDAVTAGNTIGASNHTSRWLDNVNFETAAGNGAAADADGASSITLTRVVADDWWASIGLDIVAATGSGTVGRLVGGTLCGGVLVGGLLTGF